MSTQNEITDFFTNYGKAFNDGEKLAQFYGDCAMASSPTFVGCLKGDKEVRAALNHIAMDQILYVVRKSDGKYQILFSVAHQDEEEMRKELGVS